VEDLALECRRILVKLVEAGFQLLDALVRAIPAGDPMVVT
jgi:hypothetical protein